MILRRLKEQYINLYSFLAENFHKDAYYENGNSLSLNELIDQVIEPYFTSSYSNETPELTDLLKEMDNFKKSLIYESYKTMFLSDAIEVDTAGLTSMEFMDYLYARLKIEAREREIIEREEEKQW